MTTERQGARSLLRLLAVVAMLLVPAVRMAAQDAVVRGTVRAPDGRPLAYAEIHVGDSSRARTDSAGAFVIGGLPAGEIELLVRRLGYAPVSVPMRLAAGQRRTLAIELAPLPYALSPVVVRAGRPGIYGQVVDEAGVPLAGAEVIVAGSGRRTTSAADGGFAMPELAGGMYMVFVRLAGRYPAQFSVALPADRGQEVRIALAAIGDGVRGSARDAAAGFFWADAAHLRDLDRRLQVNQMTLVPRAVLERQGNREMVQVLGENPAALLAPAPSARGPKSIAASGTEERTAPDADLRSAATSGQWCYFLDGEPATDMEFFFKMPASWVESVEIVQNDATSTLLRRLPAGGKLCRRYIVVWTRR